MKNKIQIKFYVSFLKSPQKSILLLLSFFSGQLIAQTKIQDSTRKLGSYITYQSYRVSRTSDESKFGYLSMEDDYSVRLVNQVGKLMFSTNGAGMELGQQKNNPNTYLSNTFTNDKFSIISQNNLKFYTNSRGLNDGNEKPQMEIDTKGNIYMGSLSNLTNNINIYGHINSFGTFNLESPIQGTQGAFFIRPYKRNSYVLGADSELHLKAGLRSLVHVKQRGYVVINSEGENDSDINISNENIGKYSLFVTKGLLSEEYGLAPKNVWADYVFDKTYKLNSLPDVKTYVEKNGHLPNMFTAKQVRESGYSLHEMNVKLLEKIEELTLYAIDQDKEINNLKILLKELKSLDVRMKNLESKK